METHLEKALNEINAQPDTVGCLITNRQGLCLGASGRINPNMSGIGVAISEQACKLEPNLNPPTIVLCSGNNSMMTTIFNLFCPICIELFHNGEDIHCTSCGHVMHYRCLEKWREWCASCPQCRSSYSTTHKLYLSFDESDGYMKELQSELNKLKDKTKALQDDLKAKENEISALKEKYGIKSLLCTVCDKFFVTEPMLTYQQNAVHVMTYRKLCHICGATFRNVESFRRHISNHKELSAPPPLMCKLCALKEKQGIKSFLCTVCDKLFATVPMLTYHQNAVHFMTYRKLCDICSATFRNVESFRRHMGKHDGISAPPSLMCEVCGRIYADKHNFEIHMNSQHPMMPNHQNAV